MKKYIVLLIILLTLNGCATKERRVAVEKEEIGKKTYVDETEAKERLTVLSDVEVTENGTLIVRSSRYVYGVEMTAPIVRSKRVLKKDGDLVTAAVITVFTGGLGLIYTPNGADSVVDIAKGHTQTLNELGVSVDREQGKATGSVKWHDIDDGQLSIEVKTTNSVATKFQVRVGYESIDLNSILKVLKGGSTQITVGCDDCADFLPPELIAQIPKAGMIVPLGKTAQINFDLNAYRVALKQNAEAARQAEVQRKRDERQAEIDTRKARAQQEQEERESAKRAQQEQARIARDGDGSADDRTCQKYGFKPSSQGYASCRMQIDQARQQLAQQQAQQQAAYEAQRQQYEEAKAERDKERKRQQGLKMMELGLGIASGKYNQSNAYGALPPAPTPPSNQPLRTTIQLPNGAGFMHCETRGNDTFCF